MIRIMNLPPIPTLNQNPRNQRKSRLSKRKLPKRLRLKRKAKAREK